MQKTSSPKKSRPSESKASPSRQSLLNAYNKQSEDAGELHHQVLELIAENEHVKNIMIGLNEKLLAFNDFKQDVENHKAMLKSSEGEREQWQIKVRTISQKVIVDAEQHTSYEQTLISENDQLRKELEQMRVTQQKAWQSHLDEMSKQSAEHATIQKRLHEQIEQINRDNSETHQRLI